MQKDAKSMLGKKVPVFFTEIGIPFDMDDKKAYITNDYSSQTAALDALGFALEGSNLSYTLWCYCSINSHIWGDNWNNEDFRFGPRMTNHSITIPEQELLRLSHLQPLLWLRYPLLHLNRVLHNHQVS